MSQAQNPISKSALLLGLAGLLPQAASCIIALTYSQFTVYALVAGFAYAGLIFSFVGGVWWGQALQAPVKHSWIFVVAVCPSLIAWVSAVLLFSHLKWWPYATTAIAVGLLSSPLVDLQIGKVLPQPKVWMQLRWLLSIGLGCLTMILATLALHAV